MAKLSYRTERRGDGMNTHWIWLWSIEDDGLKVSGTSTSQRAAFRESYRAIKKLRKANARVEALRDAPSS